MPLRGVRESRLVERNCFNKQSIMSISVPSFLVFFVQVKELNLYVSYLCR